MEGIPGYQLKEELYRSRGSVVFRGLQEENNLAVILKFTSGKSKRKASDEINRLKHEFAILRRLQHPGVIKAHNFKSGETNGNTALILEDFGGISLKKILAKQNVSLTAFLRIAIKLSEILEFVHSQNIIHKDIKSSNIILNKATGVIKIADFGSASLLSRENQEAINPTNLEGSLPYISPEQTGRMNRSIDYRTDFYSLGVVFYEMLTGSLPFSTQDPMELVHCHIAKHPDEPVALNPKIPKVISEIVMKLMSKAAEERYSGAGGLKEDLRKCLGLLKEKGKVEYFEPGENDIPDKFQIPQKLYGREAEIERLMHYFRQIASGEKRLVLVKGYSGIGKSSMVNEIHKPVVKHQGLFVSGKFDQFKRDAPYSALIESFQELIRQILTGSELEIINWKFKISKALGLNAQVIIDVIPELELITGKQQDVPALPSAETLNRFQSVFRNFIRVFATREHPLVIFLDDLQWADTATLEITRSFLTDPNGAYLMIIAGFRDNEVGKTHPLNLTLEKLNTEGVRPKTISVSPLNKEHLCELLSDTLRCSPTEAGPLAELVRNKTGGNPFFAREFLLTLHENHLIRFNSSQNIWTWETEKIVGENITDNVVELLAHKINEISEAPRTLLKLASCLGNSFSLEELSIASGKNLADCVDTLWEPLHSGMLLPIGDSYKMLKNFLQVGKNPEQSLKKELKNKFRFLHDRVQQAAYTLIKDEDRAELHLIIGRRLKRLISPEQKDDYLITIVNHLNQGFARIETNEELIDLIKLNLTAGKRAKLATAYRPALKYLNRALLLLPRNSWEKNYDICVELYTEAAEAEFLNGRSDEMRELVEQVRLNARTALEQVRVHETLMSYYTSTNRMSEAVDVALDICARLKVSLPQKAGNFRIFLDLLKTFIVRRGRPFKELIDLPIMESKEYQAVIRILVRASPPAYITRPDLLPIFAFTSILLTLKHGIAPYTSYFFVIYGLILTGKLDLARTGFESGELAIALLDKEGLDTRLIRQKSISAHYYFIPHFSRDPRYADDRLQQGLELAMEVGDYEYYSWNGIFRVILRFVTGAPLPELMKEYKNIIDLLTQVNQKQGIDIVNSLHQLIGNFHTEKMPTEFSGAIFDFKKNIEYMEQDRHNTGIYMAHMSALIFFYFSGKFETALEHAEKAYRLEQEEDAALSMPVLPVCRFYHCLTLLALSRNSPTPEKNTHIKRYKLILKRYKTWAKNAPMNYKHRLDLIMAELARVKAKHKQAELLYDRAIEGAKNNRYTQDQALSCELAGEYYLSVKKPRLARLYIEDALKAYKDWGSGANQLRVKSNYSELFTEQEIFEGGRETLGDETDHTVTITRTSSSNQNSPGFLDISSILKASTTLSEDIRVQSLLGNMLHILMENTGAGVAYFLQRKRDELYVEARRDLKGDETEIIGSDPLKNRTDLPISVINYVSRTSEVLILNDAAEDSLLGQDPYIATHKPKSIFCMPIIHQQKLFGLIYMENNLAAGAFTKNKLEAPRLLASQLAISLKNANLYSDMEEMADSFARFVPGQFLESLEKESVKDIELGDAVEKHMTILFSDIRDFTTISEMMNVNDNFRFLNSYLKRMGPAINRNHGFIDKFIGDAIMALFAHYPENAVKAAIEMRLNLNDFNTHRAEQGLDPIEIGIGLHTGDVMLGTVGSTSRLDTTVIGDAVNLAARIESLTKKYGATIIFSEALLKFTKKKDQFLHREIDIVRVKGKRKAVKIFELYETDPPEQIDLKNSSRQSLNEAILIYRDRKFNDAIKLFGELHKKNPEDPLPILYNLRCERRLKIPPDDDWDGVSEMF